MVSAESRVLRAHLKSADAGWLACYAARVKEQASSQLPLCGTFGAGVILVPVPSRVPGHHCGPWAAQHLAIALRNAGLACAVWPGLRRIAAVRKSATARCRERPSVLEHYRSLAVDASLLAPDRLLLVDDVVTKGRTLLAGAMRLHEVFPEAEIRAFALLRTMGLVPDIGRLLEPCQGEISWLDADARRNP